MRFAFIVRLRTMELAVFFFSFTCLFARNYYCWRTELYVQSLTNEIGTTFSKIASETF